MFRMSHKTIKSFAVMSILFLFTLLSTSCNRGFRDLDVFSSEAPWEGIKQVGVANGQKSTGVTANGTIVGRGIAVNKITNETYSVGYTDVGIDGNTQGGIYDYFIIKYSSGGKKLWTKQFSATLGIGPMVAIAAQASTIDKAGNIIVGGFMIGNYGGQTGTGFIDSFVAKHDSSGNLLWVRLKGDGAAQAAYIDLAVDNNNNIYAAGFTEGSIDGNTNSGARDALLVKFSPNGTTLYTKQSGNGNGSEATGVVCDSNNNVYYAGLVGSNVNFDGETANSVSNVFIQKFDSTGLKAWTQFREPQTVGMIPAAIRVAVDGDNNLGIAGFIFNAFGDTNSFIYKLNSTNGADIWSHQIVNPGIKTSYQALAIDKDNNLIVGGYVNGGIDGNALIGVIDEVIIKYDTAGVRQWTTQLGGSGSTLAPYAVTTDDNGNIFSVGFFDANIGGLPVIGAKDTFTLKLNSSGVVQ